MSKTFQKLPSSQTLSIDYAPISVKPEGGGGGVGHRVGILTCSKKIIKIPTPGEKESSKLAETNGLLLFYSIKLKDECMMPDQNPHPGDTRHSQIPVGWVGRPPPPLGLDIDSCIILQYVMLKEI